MQIGYVLYDPETLKVLCLSKGKRAVELIDIKEEVEALVYYKVKIK